MSRILGATPFKEHRCQFEVWAPNAERVEVLIVAPSERVVLLERDANGYHHAEAKELASGARYFYRLDDQKQRPDPASRFQPQGVHGPSEIVDRRFNWHDDAWKGLPLEEYLLYEIHVGTFTPEGTFDAAARRLDDLRDLGVTAIELMPVAQFPGSHNWGYDGVYPFSAQASYGGPSGLHRFVDACHQRGMAVSLDVVYNHLGPEGNYLADFGPYFTDRYRTPWGRAINFDGPESDEVRRYFIENALAWVTEFHIDALRLDAIHSIVDPSALPFLQELGNAVHEQAEKLGRRVLVIPESDRNDSRFITRRDRGGMGLDGQWSDDFHHALHTLLTGEKAGYYRDFGRVSDLATAYRDGYVYSGRYSRYRRRRHGNSSRHLAAKQFIVFAQNHDQIGNRMLGERLSQLVSFEALKLAAGCLLLSPFVPMLFMGEEYGETAPFLYFTSHSDPSLIEAVRKGRREEFAAFRWQGEIPDPQDELTFERSKLIWESRGEKQQQLLREFHAELIRLRKSLPALVQLTTHLLEVKDWEKEKVLMVRRWCKAHETIQVMNFSPGQVEMDLPIPEGRWRCELDSSDARWGGKATLADREVESAGIMTCGLPAQCVWLLSRSLENEA